MAKLFIGSSDAFRLLLPCPAMFLDLRLQTDQAIRFAIAYGNNNMLSSHRVWNASVVQGRPEQFCTQACFRPDRRSAQFVS